MPSAQQGLFISDAAQLGPDTVGASEIAADAVSTSEIAANAVGDSEIAAHTTSKITVPEANISGPLAIARGGTGQASQTAAFDALSPLTTQGDVMYHNGTDNVRLGPGTSGQFLKTNGAAANPEWATLSSMAKVAIVPKAVSVSNTATETNLMSFTLGANELSTANMLYVRLCLSNMQENAGVTLIIKCYYGATSIDFTSRDLANVDGEGYIDFYIAADGATNDQQLTAQIHTSRAGFFTNATHDDLKETITGAAAIDSTAAQTVKITATWSGADATANITAACGFAYIIK